PFYNECIETIKGIILDNDPNLAIYLYNSIKKIASFLDMETNIILSSTLEKNNNLKSEEKVLAICKIVDATEYYNAIGGQELYSKQEFEEKGIKLRFLKANLQEYSQFKNEFVSGLSIIDVLMFNGKKKTIEMLKDFELV
ncbi:MAG: WbqC family protein, partial [Clostridia bacterium]